MIKKPDILNIRSKRYTSVVLSDSEVIFLQKTFFRPIFLCFGYMERCIIEEVI